MRRVAVLAIFNARTAGCPTHTFFVYYFVVFMEVHLLVRLNWRNCAHINGNKCDHVDGRKCTQVAQVDGASAFVLMGTSVLMSLGLLGFTCVLDHWPYVCNLDVVSEFTKHNG